MKIAAILLLLMSIGLLAFSELKPQSPMIIAINHDSYNWTPARWYARVIQDEGWAGGGYVVIPPGLNIDEEGARVSVSQCTKIWNDLYQCQFGSPKLTDDQQRIIHHL